MPWLKHEILKEGWKPPSTCLHTILEKGYTLEWLIKKPTKQPQVKCKSDNIPEADP